MLNIVLNIRQMNAAIASSSRMAPSLSFADAPRHCLAGDLSTAADFGALTEEAGTDAGYAAGNAAGYGCALIVVVVVVLVTVIVTSSGEPDAGRGSRSQSVMQENGRHSTDMHEPPLRRSDETI